MHLTEAKLLGNVIQMNLYTYTGTSEECLEQHSSVALRSI